MKATLSFNLPEERDEFETAVNAGKYKAALWEISQRVFRPARKHGYSNPHIQKLLDTADTDDMYEVAVGTELVSELEKLFYEILQEEGIEI